MARVRINPEVARYRQPERVRIEKPLLQLEWSGVFEGWARNFINRNFWRVEQHFGDKTDAVQECAMLFYRCRNKYEYKINNPRWFMALFQRTVSNHFHTLSVQQSAERSLQPIDFAEQVDYNTGFLVAAISGCSQEAQDVLKALVNAPTELLQILFQEGDSPGKPIQRVKRLLGISGSPTAILAELKQLLS